MHAVVVTVNIAAGQFEHSRKSLQDNVVPRVKQAPGLVKAYWSISGDKGHGLSFLVFKTQQDAENAAKMVGNSPMPPGVTPAGVEIREVVAEA